MWRATLVWSTCIVLGAPGWAQPLAKRAAALDCRACHTADTPTKKDPALAACPRLLITGYHSVGDAPRTMTLGGPGGTYGPVRFSHREHASMAETGKGCSGCHHYDQARQIQECKACHSETRLRTDLGRPDLRGAMHRQCLECHREWSPASKCGSCHGQPGAGSSAGAAARPAKTTKAAAPARVVYQVNAAAGRTVTFFHDDHTRRFGLRCADCHRQQSCTTCHGPKALAQAVARAQTPGAAMAVLRTAGGERTAAEAHARCSSCHVNDRCATCHAGATAQAAPFNHAARTGWALNRFHAPLDCRRCHTAPGGFTKVKADCESCHAGWTAKFDHRKTGLALDELHTGVDCVSCHEDAAFVAAPVCGTCHSDKSYPADKPGRVVAGTVKRK